MSKGKRGTGSKQPPSPRKAKARRATQSTAESPKDSPLHAEAAGSTESLPERHDDSKPQAPLVESPATALQDDLKQTMGEHDSNKTFAFPPAVESPKDDFLHSEAAGSTEPAPERHDDSRPEAPVVESPVTALQDDRKQTIGEHDSKEAFAFPSAVKNPNDSLVHSEAAASTEPLSERHDDPKPEPPLVASPATALQDDRKQTTREHDSKKAFAFPSATANVQAYQAKLLEMARADVQFAFEFAERLATMRSPVEFPRVIAEFTDKRIAIFIDNSKELVELSTGRRE
jgi:hypothetical protein